MAFRLPALTRLTMRRCQTQHRRILTASSSSSLFHSGSPLWRRAPESSAAASSSSSSSSSSSHHPSTTRPSEEQCAAESGAVVAPPSAGAPACSLASVSSAPTPSGRPPHAYPLPSIGSDAHFDLVVIGSGPAGQKCAIDAAKKGKRVCVVDKAGMFGGVCIHTGTIPSKTFREAILHVTAHNQRGFGGEVMARSPSLSRDVLDRVKKVEQWETETILKQLHRNKVMTIAGTARFIDENHIEVVTEGFQAQTSPAGHTKLSTLGTGTAGAGVPGAASVGGAGGGVGGSGAFSIAGGGGPISELASLSTSHYIRGDKFLIAAGSRPVRNPNYPWESPLVFDSDAILKNPTWGEIKNLIVVGAGVIALEYASMFNTLPNCKVTIIDERPSFLDFIDGEVIDTLKYVMRRQGATFLLGEKVKTVRALPNGTQVRVDLESGKDVVGDALFYAVGRQAESDSLTLDCAGVSLGKRGLIPVNEFFQTSQAHIYASGDIIGFPALASTSMEQGRLCSQHMFGQARPMKPVFPYGIYTIPEISVVGHSEQELTKLRIPYKTGMAKYEETAKGQMMGGPHIDGFLKLLFCPTSHRLLGASCIGEQSTEIIHIGQAVMSMNGTIEYFRDSVFNYPTYAELFRIAALDGLNKMGAMNGTNQNGNGNGNGAAAATAEPNATACGVLPAGTATDTTSTTV